jgi:hypothetical protein
VVYVFGKKELRIKDLLSPRVKVTRGDDSGYRKISCSIRAS